MTHPVRPRTLDTVPPPTPRAPRSREPSVVPLKVA